MEIVSCKGVEKIYGTGENQVRALDGIDLSIEKGEFVSIVGPSGSGKSTLLHILGSVDKPTAGTVMVDGIDVGRLTPTNAAIFRRRNVGLIYQFYNLIPTLDLEQNILMPLLLDRRKPDRDHFHRLVSLLGLQGKLKALPHQLSGGQQQRAAIARALIARPGLILADEPTGNLDRKNAGALLELLKQMNRELNQTILLITHDEGAAREAGRIVTIADGKITDDRAGR